MEILLIGLFVGLIIASSIWVYGIRCITWFMALAYNRRHTKRKYGIYKRVEI